LHKSSDDEQQMTDDNDSFEVVEVFTTMLSENVKYELKIVILHTLFENREGHSSDWKQIRKQLFFGFELKRQPWWHPENNRSS
jgi:hypothetical protein